MALSILHRMTGVALSLGLIAWVTWLEAISWENVPYDAVMAFMGSWIGQLMLLGWLFSFFFHLANGVRHLIWDTGRLFEKRQADSSAWFVLAAAIVMTAGYWLMARGG
jgi:succinate dehydrogenase / fumarate reductase cytochrome b subunit